MTPIIPSQQTRTSPEPCPDCGGKGHVLYTRYTPHPVGATAAITALTTAACCPTCTGNRGKE